MIALEIKRSLKSIAITCLFLAPLLILPLLPLVCTSVISNLDLEPREINLYQNPEDIFDIKTGGGGGRRFQKESPRYLRFWWRRTFS